jgi:hypothetical protein
MMKYLDILLFFIIGAMLIAYPSRMWLRVLAARKLPMIDGIILGKDILEIPEPMAGWEDKRYQAKISFSAIVNSITVVSSILCPDLEAYKYVSASRAAASVSQYIVGAPVKVRVLSQTPPALMLTAQLDSQRQRHYLAWGAFGVLVWVAMIPMVLNVV